ncbi:PPOX class F420-dependent oxidoreductase [Williamsia sterculiae]|uniref:PPOX class probable F420-dependent enzyme n=1 Tax=Williamsia sterculiae TaxID=1344003 RepID=A0A1N7GS75_9NOCA|nr:PPOX class F420-dependent oxidoreductase [Williamsia sterculiae]SIS15453.1 PPOX class probable F420-dependent enzyme [Williamsia sterculiae]
MSTADPTDGRDDALYALFAEINRSILITQRRDGRPQVSNVNHAFDPVTRTARISVTADRVKTRNVARDPRVTLHVTSADFWSYAVADGDAELGPVASEPGDSGIEELVDLYRAVAGEHPDWDDYTRAMITDRRQVLHISFDHVYGQAPR